MKPVANIGLWFVLLFIVGEQKIGNKRADPQPDILLSGLRYDAEKKKIARLSVSCRDVRLVYDK